MALSPKDRERIIEEETLRYETRQNLCKKACNDRPLRWPWVVLGALLVYGLWCYVFCAPGSGSCGHHGKMGMKSGHKCSSMMWAPEENKDVEPGQPVAPSKK